MEGHVLNENDIAALLPPRRRESSKGENGHGLLLAGSADMPGAALMHRLPRCARALAR